ncbi:hypothetical protein EON77_11275 [bacterium]|nr:MAG: hypothetical protein EON77_11275 [bacterium]
MRVLSILVLVALASALLGGCGSAPSTPLAPDKVPPDTSKMSPEDVEKLLKQNGAGDGRTR